MPSRIPAAVLVLSLGFLQQPVFRSGTDLVEVDAVVLDRDGTAVRGLTAADFEVLDEGAPQEIATFAFVEVSPRPMNAPAEMGVASTEAQRGAAIYLLVIDYLHTPAKSFNLVRDKAREFVRDHMRPEDLAAVVHLGLSTRGVEFTGDKRRLLAAIDAVRGSAGNVGENPSPDVIPSGAGNDSDAFNLDGLAKFERMLDGERAATAYEMLSRAAQYAGGLTGRRKSMLLFSSGVPIPLEEQVSSDPSKAERASRFARSHAALVRIARQSNLNINTIHARGLDRSDQPNLDSLRMLAHETGGRAFVNYNKLAEPFRQITIDNGSYYLLGFRPKEAVQEGKFRRLTVRVKRDGVQVLARPGYGRPRPADVAESIRPIARAWNGTGVSDLLDRPLPTLNGGLPLRAGAHVIRREGSKATVLLSLELERGALRPDASEIQVGYRALDARGRIVANGLDTTRLRVSDATRAAIDANGWRYLTTIDLEPGAYQLRIAARETAAADGGSVFLDLEVPDLARQPLVLDSVVFGSSVSRAVPTAASNAELLKAWPVPPTPRREFGRSETLTIFVRVSGASNRPIKVDVAVNRADGHGMLAVSRDLPPGPFSDGPAIPLELALAPFEPGEYVMRVAVSAAGATDPDSVRHAVFRVR